MILATISVRSIRAAALGISLLDDASASVVAIVGTVVNLAAATAESVRTFTLIPIGGGFPTDATILAFEVGTVFALRSAVVLRTTAR